MTSKAGITRNAPRAPALCRAARRAAIAVVPAFLGACASLSSLPQPAASFAAPRAEQGTLADNGVRLEASLADGESAYWLLDNNADSLSLRIALTDLAVETLDIQYFIWQDDMTGRLLMQHVMEAADRGVRVRFFVDDLTLSGRDREIAGLDAHPSIEVRVFNPWTRRSSVGRPLEFVFRSRLLNHRMHNKIFVADGWFGILGGRNIGDRYFGVYEEFVQNDIDIMVAGPLLRDIVASFDEYWNHELSYPVFWRDGDADGLLSELRRGCAASSAANDEMLAAFTPPDDGWSPYLGSWMSAASRGAGRLLLDTPSVHRELPTQLYEEFKALVSRAERELLLSSPYLIPDREFVAQLERLAERGVEVKILTNSLASNSHVIAHSAYKKWRRALLRTGAELYEMRADAEVLEYFSTPPAEPRALALHTKALVVDGRWTFVGSPNVDPRSMILNTEIGLVADDPQLAARIRDVLTRDMEPENSWRVTLDAEGWLEWSSGEESLERQPARDFRQRAMEFFLNLIPIKKQA